MAVTTRLELATPGVTSRCSDQTELSHLVPVAAAAGFLAMALASAAGGGWPPCLPTGATPATGQVRFSPPPERTICVRASAVLPQSRISAVSTALRHLSYLALVSGPREGTRGPPLAQS